MKTLFSLLLILHLLMQSNAFAQLTTQPTPFNDPNPYQSQTWVRFQNGLIKTMSALNSKGQSYLFEQPNALPAVYAAGANYGIFKNQSGYMLAVVDALGRFYPYGKTVEPNVIGGVYFTKKGTNELIVIDSDGASMQTTMIAPSIKLAGGNFFIDQNNTLTTIKSMGAGKWNWAGMVTEKAGMVIPTPIFAGGNYFVDMNQKITTISSINGFFSDPYPLPSGISVQYMGGNYLITSDLKLYTINNNGDFNFAQQFNELPVLKGYSYLIFSQNNF